MNLPQHVSAGLPVGFAIRHGLLLVLILAALIRLQAAVNLACISRDGVQFVTFAKRLAVEPIPVIRETTRQPGMSALMLAVNRIAINPVYQEHPLIWQACGQLLSVAGGVAVCLLILLLARRLFHDEWLALLAGLLACVWPQGVQLSGDVLSDMPHLALYLSALLVGHAAIERKCLRRLALCGLLAALAYLIRQEALGVLSAVFIGWLWPRPAATTSRRLAGLVVLSICFVVPVSPYSVAAGRIMPNKTIGELLWGSPPPSSSMTCPVHHDFHAFEECHDSGIDVPAPSRDIALREPATAHLVPWYQAPARMVEEWSKSGRYIFSTLILFALFLRSAPKAERSCARLVLLAVALQVLAVQLRVKSYGEISSRYLVIPAALCIPWAAAGMATVVRLLALRMSMRGRGEEARPRGKHDVLITEPSFAAQDDRRLRSLWLSASILVFAPLVYYASQQFGADKASYKLAGWWLRSNTDPKERILAHEDAERIMFYAGRTWPATTWVHFDIEADLEHIRRLIVEYRPDYYIDAPVSRSGLDRPTTSRPELLGAPEGWPLKWSSGDLPHAVRIYRPPT